MKAEPPTSSTVKDQETTGTMNATSIDNSWLPSASPSLNEGKATMAIGEQVVIPTTANASHFEHSIETAESVITSTSTNQINEDEEITSSRSNGSFYRVEGKGLCGFLERIPLAIKLILLVLLSLASMLICCIWAFTTYGSELSNVQKYVFCTC